MNKIIISLTTYPQRINCLSSVIKSILNQSILPDKIIVFAYEKELNILNFSDDIYKNQLIEIRFVKENLKGHKKYFYAFSEFFDDFVITIDDDCLYHQDTIKKLLEYSKLYPQCVICNRGRFIFYQDDSFTPYKNWIRNYPIGVPSDFIMATGCLGVLYPPHWYDDQLFNINEIQKEPVLSNDDVWLKYHELRLGIKTVITDINKSLNFINNTQNSSLCDYNHKKDYTNQAINKLFDSNIKKYLQTELFKITDIIYEGRHSVIKKKDYITIKTIKDNESSFAHEALIANLIMNSQINTHRILGLIKSKKAIIYDFLHFENLPNYLDKLTFEKVSTKIQLLSSIHYNEHWEMYHENNIKALKIYAEKYDETIDIGDLYEGNQCFIHGDLNRNNVKLVGDEIYFIDFENACFGPQWWDKLYFISDYDYDKVSYKILSSLTQEDIKRIILITKIRIGRLVRKNMDDTNRIVNLKKYQKLLKGKVENYEKKK